MARRGTPVFLERRRYHMRRIMDGVRVLPLVGLVLWMIPLLWPSEGAPPAERVTTSQALVYIFLVWCALVIVSAFLSDKTRDIQDDPEDPDQMDETV